jgi:FtsH-binding integral membrane protein
MPEVEMKFLKWFGFALVVLVVFVAVLLAANVILPEGWTLSSEILLGLAAIGLSLVLSYWPSVRVQFASLPSHYKSLVNLISVFLLAIIMYLGVCVQFFEIPGLVCTAAGIKQLAIYVIIAVGGNQLAYIASAQPADVIEAKIIRDVESG